MSTEYDSAESHGSAVERSSIAAGNDSYLDLLVRMADKFDIGYGITLNVKGLIISGQIISAKLYFERLAKNIAMGAKTEENAPLIEALAISAQHIADGIAKARSERDDISPDPAEFIHLYNVKMVGTDGSSIPTSGVSAWRGKMSSVDGFIIGAISSS